MPQKELEIQKHAIRRFLERTDAPDDMKHSTVCKRIREIFDNGIDAIGGQHKGEFLREGSWNDNDLVLVCAKKKSGNKIITVVKTVLTQDMAYANVMLSSSFHANVTQGKIY